MGDVVKLEREPEGPWLAGKAKCLDCATEWAHVSPVGTLYLECPQCKTQRGVLYAPCDGAEGEGIWTCGCGCDLFKIVAENGRYKWTICLRCGTPQDF